jgi:hypothetical protein
MRRVRLLRCSIRHKSRRFWWWRTWWAHFEFTRINIEPIILRQKIEELREPSAMMSRRVGAIPVPDAS